MATRSAGMRSSTATATPATCGSSAMPTGSTRATTGAYARPRSCRRRSPFATRSLPPAISPTRKKMSSRGSINATIGSNHEALRSTSHDDWRTRRAPLPRRCTTANPGRFRCSSAGAGRLVPQRCVHREDVRVRRFPRDDRLRQRAGVDRQSRGPSSRTARLIQPLRRHVVDARRRRRDSQRRHLRGEDRSPVRRVTPARADADRAPLAGPDLAPGVVVAAHRRHYIVELDAGGTIACVLKGRSLTLACGDGVRVAREASGDAIVEIEPRVSLLYRSDGFREKLIAANVTQVLGVIAPDVPVDEHLLNRWIIAAETEQCRFVLVLNKADLPSATAFADRFASYAALGYPIVQVAATRDVEALQPWLDGQHSVVIGQSGMGKSTLI